MDPQSHVAAMDLVAGGALMYDAHQPGSVAGAIIVDITPNVARPSTFDTVQRDLAAMKAMDLSTLRALGDGVEMLTRLGVESSQMRNFLLTNLTRKPSAALDAPPQFEWKCNLDVLLRDFDKMLLSIDALHPKFQQATIPTPLKRCDVPVIFVFGAKSPYNTVSGRGCIHDYFSHVEEVVIEGAGHFVHYEKMNEFVEAVAPFMYEHMGL